MKVLIVDDRADNRLLLRAQLRALDADAVTVDNGARALREMRKQPFDLVVTDLLMPEIDGFQLCYLLKTEPALKKTPVVIYTANYATRQDEAQAKSLGADDFITRPIDEEELAARLRKVRQLADAGIVAEPRTEPEEGFFRQYSTLLIEKLEDQLITAEENVRLAQKNAELQRDLEDANSNLKSANADLVRSNGDLESFSYSVSHDLRAPLRAIEGMTACIREELGESATESVKRSISRVFFNVHRMDALVSGLLEHSRMRHVSSTIVPVELDQVIAAAIAGLDDAIKEADAEVTVRHPLPAVLAHDQVLLQIVTNLLSNALKFVAQGVKPAVEISAQHNGDAVRVRVRDNGIGVPPERRARLFQMFERLHPDAPYAGTGIGLAIVRRGIEQMGGSVGLEPTSGAGSTFWFDLKPIDAASAAAPG